MEEKKIFFCRDRVVAIVCLVLSIVVYVAASHFPMSLIDAMGSGLYPQILSVLFGICSIALFFTAKPSQDEINAAAAKAVAAQHPEDKEAIAEAQSKVKKMDWKSAVFIFVMLWIYYFLFKPTGFFISTFIFCAAFCMWFDRRPNKKKKYIFGALFSVVFTIIMYLLFKIVLKVMLPTLFL